MIVNYHRPDNLVDALNLLKITTPVHFLLGGGTYVSHGYDQNCAVIDLQYLKLGEIFQKKDSIIVGATVTLSKLQNYESTPEQIKTSLSHEKNINIRNQSTIAGTLKTSSGRSIFTGLLLALDSRINYEPGSKEINIEDFLNIRNNWNNIITSVKIPCNNSVIWESISRTPSDFPIIYVAVSKLSNGRTRIVLGGSSKIPILVKDVKSDNLDKNDILLSLENACSLLDSRWSTTNYYKQISALLLKRLL